jgi:hypothetical protein
VAPAVDEVVLVEEPLSDAQAEVGKLDLMRVVAEPQTARVGHAVFPAVDDEAVQVLVAPAQGDLEGGVEVGEAAVASDQQLAPDQGADATQHHAELVDGETGRRRRTGHPGILHLIRSGPSPGGREGSGGRLHHIVTTLPSDLAETASIPASSWAKFVCISASGRQS